MRSIFWWGVLIFGIVVVLYFSWIKSPRFEYNQWVPSFLAKWADKHENDNVRTAVPLVFLGLVTGSYLIYRKLPKHKWLICWLGLSVLVVIAELGQLFLPLRSPDFKDVYWGALGAGLGLGFMFIIKPLFFKIK